MSHFKYLAALLVICTWLYSCRQDVPVILDYNGYPKEVGDIILAKCATPGCHNDVSKSGAAGLSLTSWNKLFEGSNAGSSVIPYRPDQSFLFFSLNTFPDLGGMLYPTMPYNRKNLSREQVLVIKNWILSGAPNADGFVKFSDNPQRKKVYVLNSRCEQVSVFDKETMLIMRYIEVGNEFDGITCTLEVSADNEHWYVLFTAENSTSVLKKFRAIDDQLVGKIALGNSSWKTMKISSDSKKALIADVKGNDDYLGGSISLVDLQSMTLLHVFEEPADSLFFPMGIEATADFSTAYAGCFHSNYFYKIDLAGLTVSKISLDPSIAPVINNVDDTYNPVQIILSPDESEYFVLCSNSHEVRFFNRANDSLVATVSVGIFPLEMRLSKKNNYLFVSDTSAVNLQKGAVYVLDYKSHTLITNIAAGNQPQGMAVDDEKGLLYVANRNIGGAAHHEASCIGIPGYMSVINMNTLQLVPSFRTEVSVQPIAVGIRY